MGVDISKTVAPKVDQLTADDLLQGPLVGKVTRVFSTGNKDQPIGIDIDSWPLPWKPCKGMRVVLCGVWGDNTSDEYIGRSLRLFRNPDVKYSGIAVGGIEVSAVTNITKAMTIAIRVSRGVKRNVVIQPLRDVDLPQNAEKNKAAPKSKEPESTPKDKSPANPSAEVTALLAALDKVTDQAGLDALSQTVARLWPLIDKPTGAKITAASNAVKARIVASQPLFERLQARIAGATTRALLSPIMVDADDWLKDGKLTAVEHGTLIVAISEKLAAIGE